MTSDARVCARATPSLTRTRAAYLLLVKSTFTRRNFELCCAQARRGVAYTHYLGSACCRGGTARLTTHRVMRHTRCPGMNRTPGYHCCRRALDGSTDGSDGLFIRLKPDTKKALRQPLLIGLVHNDCPHRAAPRRAARQEQPRFCSARRSSAGGRLGCQLSWP